jgi:hypothetical protein
LAGTVPPLEDQLGWALDGTPERLQTLPGAPVESVIRAQRNGPLFAAIAQLWIRPEDSVLDVTYGRGMFWTRYRPAHLTTHDLSSDGVDFRSLPESDGSYDVVVFDPPYIAQGGRETSTMKPMLDRYGLYDCPQNVAQLEELISAGIHECARVTRRLLMVKCMDYINGGRYVQGRHHVVTAAMAAGLRQVDEFVHHSGAGPQSNHERQIHSRRVHSFLCVFQKPGRRARTPML